MLLARHPDLLAADNDNDDTHLPEYPLGAARHVLLTVREVHYARGRYRTLQTAFEEFRTGVNNAGKIVVKCR